MRLRWDAVPTMFAYPDDRVQEVLESPVPEPEVPNNDVVDTKSQGTSPIGLALEHSYHGNESLKRSYSEEVTKIRKKLKVSMQRARRLEEKVAALNDMVYSLLNQTILEM